MNNKKIVSSVILAMTVCTLHIHSYSHIEASQQTFDSSASNKSFESIVLFLTEEDFVTALSWIEQNYSNATTIEQDGLIKEKLLAIYNEKQRKGAYNSRSYNALNLTSAEKRLIASHPVEAAHYYTSSQIAKNYTNQKFGYNGYKDSSDAFRHAMWNGALTQRIGAGRAKVWTDAHEEGVRDRLDKAMDLHNNKLGRDIGSKYGKGGVATNAMADEINRAIRTGRGRRIVNNRLVATR
ncbi:TPA: hypothetical protein ACGO4G_001195 [Streptococcus suis]